MIWEEAETQDLIAGLAEALLQKENKFCADCGEADPKWSSTNLGIFICIKCAGIHRSLGSHISKVKSLYLDKWTPEQVKNLSNSKAKRTYEAQLSIGGMNITAMSRRDREEWIRSKYERLDFTPAQVKYAMRPFINANSLPDTLWLLILANGDHRDIGRMSQVSFRFRRLTEQQSLWRNLHEKTWSVRFWHGPSQPVGHFPNFKQLFIKKKLLITSMTKDRFWKQKRNQQSTSSILHVPELSPPSSPPESPKASPKKDSLIGSSNSTELIEGIETHGDVGASSETYFDVEWNVLTHGQEFPQKFIYVESHGLKIRLNMITMESQSSYTAVLFFFCVLGINETELQNLLKESLTHMKVSRVSSYIPSLLLGLRKPSGSPKTSLRAELAKKVASRNNVLMYVETTLSTAEINDIAVLLAEMILERLAKDPATVISGINSAPSWIPDECVTECMHCSSQFTVFNRRHHCRRCGGIFCAKCSDKKISLPSLYNNSTALLRVCDRCWYSWR